MKLIGQEKLLSILDQYTLENMPRTLLFLGESGCGKHIFTKYLADKLNLEVVDIDSNPDAQQLREYAQCPIYKIYRINLTDFTPAAQQKILKFIEEPGLANRTVLLAESEIGIEPTILNRCYSLKFEDYTKEQLMQLDWVLADSNDLIYKICNTPGQLLDLADCTDIITTYDFCKLLINKLSQANYANTISIITKINCKDDFKKIDFNLFINILSYAAYEDYKQTNNLTSLKLYKYIIERKQQTINIPFSKESFLLSLLDGLWRITR